MPHRMTPAAELSATAVEFLSAGTRTGMLGFVAQDGRPLVAPVWFVVDKVIWCSTPLKVLPKVKR